MYASRLAGEKQTERESWTRANKLTVGSIAIGVISLLVAVSGYKILSKDSTAVDVDTVNCWQFCGSTPQASQSAQSPPGSKGCVQDANDQAIRAGWRPGRNLLASDQVSEFPAFNLDRSEQDYGDERIIYLGAEMVDEKTVVRWDTTIRVQPGKTDLLRAAVHNSAAVGQLAAQGSRITVGLPNCTGTRIRSYAWVDALNRTPRQIWGCLTFVSDQSFNLPYLEGSAVYCTNHFDCSNERGVPLSNAFLGVGGQTVGYDKLDGSIPSGYQYSGVLMFKVKPQFV